MAQVSINLVCNQAAGWMPDGWGTYNLSIKNISKDDTVILKNWSLHWDGDNKNVNPLDKKLIPGEIWKINETDRDTFPGFSFRFIIL